METQLSATNGVRPKRDAIRGHPPLLPTLDLDPVQRVLLTTDGTVTQILEAFTGEPMRLVKILQQIVTLDSPMPDLNAPDGELVMHRKILLRGAVSQTNYLFAEAHVALDRLDPHMKHSLVDSHMPLGLLLRERRLETFREILSWGIALAGGLAGYFQISEADSLVFRTYRIISEGHPLMLISEHLPHRRS